MVSLGGSSHHAAPSDTHTDTHTHNRLTAFCPGLPGWAGTRKIKPIRILLKQETVSGSGISWAICKSAPRSRQITTPAPHHSVFYRPDALPVAQPTASKHWRQSTPCTPSDNKTSRTNGSLVWNSLSETSHHSVRCIWHKAVDLVHISTLPKPLLSINTVAINRYSVNTELLQKWQALPSSPVSSLPEWSPASWDGLDLSRIQTATMWKIASYHITLQLADVSTCVVPRTLSSYGDRTFAAAGPRLWNSLPV